MKRRTITAKIEMYSALYSSSFTVEWPFCEADLIYLFAKCPPNDLKSLIDASAVGFMVRTGLRSTSVFESTKSLGIQLKDVRFTVDQQNREVNEMHVVVRHDKTAPFKNYE